MENPLPQQPGSPSHPASGLTGDAVPVAPAPATQHEDDAQAPPLLLGAALVVSVAGVAGSLYLSLAMKLEACPLCLYQRTAVMGVASVLLVALLCGMNRKVPVARLAVPLALGGLVIAAFHCYLLYREALECPDGLFGLGKAPYQSLALFVLLNVVLMADEIAHGGRGRSDLIEFYGTVVIGGAIGLGCIVSGPPPKPPQTPYKEEMKGCRPPYRAPS